MRNTQQEIPDDAVVGASPNVYQTISHGLDFTNYFEGGHISHTSRPGDIFNIWGTPQETNINIKEDHQSYSDDED